LLRHCRSYLRCCLVSCADDALEPSPVETEAARDFETACSTKDHGVAVGVDPWYTLLETKHAEEETGLFRKIDDFLEEYNRLTEGTLKVLDRVTDEMLDQSVGEGHRTIRHLGWHVVTTIPEMMKLTGLPLSAIDPGSPPPQTVAEVIGGYKTATTELVDAIKANWNDESLLEMDDMYGEEWPRGGSLTALINHEIHHRGQMTVLLRQAGGTVPGLFGPAKEEWSQYGMPAPPY
jgi:uncharacterized damage-inducible protein DinB